MAWLIETTDDLIRALRENEEFRDAARRELLTRELMDLPGEFREFKSDVETQFDGVNARFDRVEARLDSLEDGQGDLKGIGLETKLYNRGPSLIATLLKVRRSERVRVAERDANSEEFNYEIDRALDEGIITDDEYDRVLRTDAIIRSRRRETSNSVYTAIESSYSVSRGDIQKVSLTAATLGKVFPDAEVHAALYYVNIAPFIEEEATRSGVHLLKTTSIT